MSATPADEIPVETSTGAEAPTVETSTDGGWKKDAKGRWFIPARGRSGVIYRKGSETVEEALARDAKGPERKPPKSKPKTPKAPAPTQVSLQELESMLADALSAPAAFAAAQGDMWAVQHFTTEGPTLARNLTAAAAHNPWLRRKLEAALTGDDWIIKLMTLIPVAAALIGYALPPIIYYFNPGFIPAEARELYKVPARDELKARRAKREQEARDAAAAPPAPPAEGADGPAATEAA